MKVIKLTSRHQMQIDGEDWFYPPGDSEGIIAYNHLGGGTSLAYRTMRIKAIGLVFDNINSDTIYQAIKTMLEYLTKISRRHSFFRYQYIGYKKPRLASNSKKRIFVFEIVAKK